MEQGNFIISVDSFYSRTPSQEPIQAQEDCQLYRISYDQLQQAFRQFPEFNFHARILTEKYYVLSDRRSSMLRRLDASERYLYTLQTQPEVLTRVPGKHIASYLGIDEATLSRIKKRME